MVVALHTIKAKLACKHNQVLIKTKNLKLQKLIKKNTFFIEKKSFKIKKKDINRHKKLMIFTSL